MGVWDAVGDFFGSDIARDIGGGLAQIGVGILRERLLPGGGQGFPGPPGPISSPGPTGMPAGRLPFDGFPPGGFNGVDNTGGGPPMAGGPSVFTRASSTVQVPAPVPFGFDKPCPSFFKAGGMTARPVRFITDVNPATGELVFWEHAGRPILFSRDLGVVRRVRKIAAKAGTVTRRRTRKR